MARPYANTRKPILDSWAIHENLAFSWKICWKNASTDVLFELPPSHEATLPTRTPRHCKRLNLAISAITKSSLLAFTIMENDPGRDPTLHLSMRKKPMAEVPGTNLAILPPRSWTKASRLDSSARIMGQGPKGGKMLQQAHLRDTGSEKKWRKKNNSSFEVVSTGLYWT